VSISIDDKEEKKSEKDRKNDNRQRKQGNAATAIDGISSQWRESAGRVCRRKACSSF
jgi:hypothetical protein